MINNSIRKRFLTNLNYLKKLLSIPDFWDIFIIVILYIYFMVHSYNMFNVSLIYVFKSSINIYLIKKNHVKRLWEKDSSVDFFKYHNTILQQFLTRLTGRYF